jgi:aspartate 1-decarboxylase
MKSKNLLILIFITILIQGCYHQREKNKVKTVKKPIFTEQVSLMADSVGINNLEIDVWNWKVNKDRIIVLSAVNRDNFLYIFTIPDFNLSGKYGTYGQGPYDFIAVDWLNMINENQIGLYDIPKLKMYTYHLTDDTLQLDKTFDFKKWDGNICKPYTFIQQFNDSLFLLKADMREFTEIELVNINNGEILQTFRNMMIRKPKTVFSTYYFEMASENDNIVLAYNYIDRIEIFQFNDSIKKIEPLIVIGSDRDQSRLDFDDYAEYYTFVICDNDYIYALNQQGQNIKNIKNSIIEIYTLSGEPVKKIILDRHITKLALDSHTNNIYGVDSYQDCDYIYVYNVSIR